MSSAMARHPGAPALHRPSIIRSSLVGVEPKAGRGRLSPAQLETHEAITLAGGVMTTCRSLDDVAAFLATLGVPSRARAPYSAISGREAACHQKRLRRAARAVGRAAKRPRRHHWHDD